MPAAVAAVASPPYRYAKADGDYDQRRTILIEALGTLPAALRAALEACRRHFVYAMLFSALLNLLFIAPMLYMLQVYDRVIPTAGGVTLLFLTFALLLALATLSLLDAIRSRLLVRASIRLDKALSGEILTATLSRP